MSLSVWSMSRTAWSLVLVCTIAIAVSEDPWALATVSTELLNVSAYDDDTDGSAERGPACALSSVGYTRLRSFVRRPADVVEPVDLRSGYCLGCSPRGPPGNRSNNPGLPESSWSKPAAIDAPPIVGVFSSAATPHKTSLEVHSANLRSEGDFDHGQDN
jgi:hypothetical protein